MKLGVYNAEGEDVKLGRQEKPQRYLVSEI
jgi:hypothetical protein